MYTVFRDWMERLAESRGAEPEWPLLLADALEHAFDREAGVPPPYGGEVFKDRDEFDAEHYAHVDREQGSGATENATTYALYYRCHFGNKWCEGSQGCLTIGDERFWLLGFQWPTCCGESDLAGLEADGGLAVFECKGSRNATDSPLVAVLKALHYLRCHTCSGDFANIVGGFRKWKAKLQQTGRVPRGFEAVEPTLGATHRAIVLAPTEYYNFHDRSRRSLAGVEGGWRRFSEAVSRRGRSVSMGFAVSSLIRTTRAEWLRPSPLPDSWLV
jgi:hypothetical protein